MDLDRAVKTLLIREPFYGLFLLNLNRYYGDKCDTACVCRNGINTELCVNKKFWDTLSDDEQLGVLKHELGHILFKHITSSEYFGDHDKFNKAADCEVNSYIPVLQKDPYCYPAHWNLENNKGTKFYYEKLPDEPDQPQGEGDSSSGNYDPNDSHASWKDFQDLSDTEKELVNQQIDHQAKNTAEHVQKIAGSIPGELSEYIGSLFKQKPAIFNWKAYFRRFLGTALDDQIRKSRKKESLRFPDSSGIKHKRKSNILIGIDTSGSVSDKDLCDFFSEINHIYKAGANIKIMEFDYGVERIYDYKGKWDGTCNGRGGTEFEQPWEYYIQHRRDFNTFVLFTDGYASTRGLRPVPNVLWIITSDGNRNNSYPGKTIFIPEEVKGH